MKCTEDHPSVYTSFIRMECYIGIFQLSAIACLNAKKLMKILDEIKKGGHTEGPQALHGISDEELIINK